MTELLVSRIELIEDGSPPIVRCEVVDAEGRTHAFVDKLAIFSRADTLPAPDAAIACAVIDVTRDPAGRRIVTVDTACPWGCTSEGAALSRIGVLEQQLVASEEVWISLAGARVPAERFGCNSGLGYGRRVDDALVYHAVLPIARLDWYAPAFARLVDDLRDDDERFGDPTPFAGCEYRRTLIEAAAFPDPLAEGIAGFCHRELLEHHFPFDAGRSDLVINSTDAVFVVAGQVIIRGRCFRRPLE
jgi:hypothetical protein